MRLLGKSICMIIYFPILVFHNSTIILFELKKAVRRLFWKRRVKNLYQKHLNSMIYILKRLFWKKFPLLNT